MERYKLERLKYQRSFGNVTSDYKAALESEEHGEELRNFEEYIASEEHAPLDAHNIAARIGMLDNIPLAKFLAELESKIDRIFDRLNEIPED